MADSVTISAAKRGCDEQVCWLWARPSVITMRLNPREVRRLDVPRDGLEILCVGGALWITQEHDPKDHFLSLGDRFTTSQPGRIVAQGM